MSDHKLYLYPKWLRVWHGINALSIIMLIATGISMQYSNINYPIINFKYAVPFHNLFGVITLINYLAFIVINSVTGNRKAYKLHFKGLINRLIKQSQYYLSGYFKGEPKPFPVSKTEKFNPLQKVAYVTAMYLLVPLVILTGLALLFPEVIIERFLKTSGIRLTAIFHASLGFLISLFLFIHLYVASVGKHPFRNYRSIITGYHED
ncbi:cytochrome b/b6 domain-containing protein [Saccharicrinis sp. FJH62]|uniref:cytochrome b/b6 domain-containing protein n=1 Tax=Saccharicrinis sp. FJH62 TaxID=3344657 RepID=UPI0035D4054D